MSVFRTYCRYISPPVHPLRCFVQSAVAVINIAAGLLSLLILCVLHQLNAYGLILHHVPNAFSARLTEIPNPYSARIATWRGQEQATISEPPSKLDVDMIVSSYSMDISV